MVNFEMNECRGRDLLCFMVSILDILFVGAVPLMVDVRQGGGGLIRPETSHVAAPHSL